MSLDFLNDMNKKLDISQTYNGKSCPNTVIPSNANLLVAARYPAERLRKTTKKLHTLTLHS